MNYVNKTTYFSKHIEFIRLQAYNYKKLYEIDFPNISKNT